MFLQYNRLFTQFTRDDICDLVQEFVKMLSSTRQENINFIDALPSRSRVVRFLSRHIELSLRLAQFIEDKREFSRTIDAVSEHIIRVKAACHRFNIRDPRYIINLNEF